MSIAHKLIPKFDIIAKTFHKKEDKVNKDGRLYYEIRDELRSFDLVFFQGGSAIGDFLRYIQSKYGSREGNKTINSDAFSHVGIVIKSDVLDDERLEDNVPYIFESTMSGYLTDGVYDINNSPFLGVQLRKLDEVVIGYDADPDARIAVAHIKEELIPENAKDLFNEIFESYEGIPYDLNPISLCSSICKMIRCFRDPVEKIAESSDWLFCSELVAHILQDMGIIPEDINCSDVVPMDFLGFDADEEKIPNILEEIIYIRA